MAVCGKASTILKKFPSKYDNYKKKCIFATSNENDGALAQLARAFDWQSRGREFDSHTLHKKALTKDFASAFFYDSAILIYTLLHVKTA